MSVATYTKAGAKAATPAKLDKAVFDVEIKHHELLKQAYSAYLANGRVNLAKTKTRGDVSGGGKKPWRQKGTGRARFGSTRVPIWRGGGIALGPTGQEHYGRKINTKAKRLAIRQALSMAANENRIAVLEDFVTKAGKTSEAAGLLKKIEAGNGKVLVIVENKTVDLVRATTNLPGVKLVQGRYANVYDIMNADKIVITNKALEVLSEWLGDKQ